MKISKLFLPLLSLFLLFGVLVAPVTASEGDQTPALVLELELEDTVQHPQPRRLFGTINVCRGCSAIMFRNARGYAIKAAIPHGSRVIMDSANATNGRLFVHHNGQWGWVVSNLVTGIQWQ